MMAFKNKLSESSVLLCGLAFTSRTETVEDYLKDKVKSLTVILLSSCFLRENLSCCRIYENGVLKGQFKIPNFRIKDYKWYRQPLIILVFLVYCFSICLTLIRLKKKYDIYIGVSQSFALWGAILKKLKVAKSLIYYCLDYWTPDPKLNFNSLFVKFINLIDRFSVRNADYIWDLKANISDERQKIGKIKSETYRRIIVPLGYSASLRRFKPLEQADRWQLGFVGSITLNQGLPLLVEALPQVLKKLPELKVKVIGQGPHLEELKLIVHNKGLDNHFDFTGFIKDENQMLEILTSSAIALALYRDDLRNITCADTGKPKLYALCGVPMITTNLCSLSEEVIRYNAGAVINYDRQELEKVILELMGNEERLKETRQNSFRLGEQFISDKIFDEAFKKMGL